MKTIKNYTATGAGLPIKLNDKGDTDLAMEAPASFVLGRVTRVIHCLCSPHCTLAGAEL